ncbi:IS4 family transposase [Megasphaera paucivorans]|uniref:Transposase DDE domain-containing protein n=1 Tax=Megasphaera paucivorans TaxID=349095 RepID=A0A1H0A8Z1_9FIRM|nr:IS4 family transposase [Megasphaera paucivorans]SDN29935.1 Transposase DDE domain-containing protein [Megasphaera paucivorans]
MNFSESVKQVLLRKIQEMAARPEAFVRNPGRDFTRTRKLDFATTIRCLIAMESGSLKKELLELFHYHYDTATTSAFSQQREKILPEALAFLFQEFNHAFTQNQSYREYRLLACDGTALNISRNSSDQENYFQSNPGEKGFSQLHLNALYDLGSRRYVDAVIQPGRKNNECRALADMIDRCSSGNKTIFIADRGYESYNIFAHAEQRGMYYLVRVKDIGRNTSMTSSFGLPQTGQFDMDVHLTLTRKQSKQAKACSGIYKFLTNNSTFDYLKQNESYPITLRVVRFPLPEDSHACVITNLPRDTFPMDELKKLCGMRWGIETSFRELKYAIGLSCLHAKKVEYIKQEIFARLLLYNFCEIITMHVVIQQKSTKHIYQVNYTLAIHICRHFLRFHTNISPPDVEMLIQKNVLPVRPGRSDPRKVKPKSVVSFLYRVA